MNKMILPMILAFCLFISPAFALSYNLTNIGDTYINSSSDAFKGTETYIELQASTINENGIMKFDISAFKTAYPYYFLNSATLILFTYDKTFSGLENMRVYAYHTYTFPSYNITNTEWTENNTNYTYRPTSSTQYNTTYEDTIFTLTTTGWKGITVTNMVRTDMSNNKNNVSIYLIPDALVEAHEAGDHIRIATKENATVANRPYLALDFYQSTITMASPTNTSYNTSSIPLNFSYSSYESASIPCYRKYNGVESLIGSIANNTYNYSLFTATKTSNNVSVTCVDTSYNLTTPTVYFSVSAFSETTVGYTSPVTPNINTTISSSISTLSSIVSDVNSSLLWNGTYYTPTKTVNSNNYYFNYTKTIPVITGASANASLRWNYTVKYTDGSTAQVNGTSYNQTINNYFIAACNATYTTKALSFNLTNEENATTYPGTYKATYVLWTTSPLVNQTYSFDLSGSYNYSLCISPSTAIYQTSAFIIYNNATFTERNYFLSNSTISNVTSNIYLYLLNQMTAVSFEVKNQYEVAEPNVIVYANRYFPESNSYKTVTMGKSGTDGTTSMNLKTNNTWYRFMLINSTSGSIIRTFEPMLITTMPIILRTSPASLSDVTDYWLNIGHQCTFNNATNILSCTATDTTGEMQQAYLTVTQKSALGNVVICNETNIGASVTLTCTLPSVTDSEYYYSFYGRQCCSIETLYTFNSGWLSFLSGVQLGSMGVLIALMIIILLSSIGWFISPELSIGLSLLGLIVSAVAGFWTISTGTLISLIVAGAILLYKVR